ncbi:G-I-Y Y-I-G endonuclease [Gordonia phage BearBQ]|nr:G-I-Y Y-I-G endonuclease [Gordonia phage BearBQ]
MSVDKSAEVRDHFVYRLFDANERLLYVGCTRRLDKRYAEHRTDKPLMIAATARIYLQGPFTRTKARAVERFAICTESPFIGWTPEKQEVSTARSRWMKSRIAELTASGTEVIAAIYQAGDEVDLVIPDPRADEYRFLSGELSLIAGGAA